MSEAKLHNALDLLRTVADYLDGVSTSKPNFKKGKNDNITINQHLRAMRLSAGNVRDQINVFLAYGQDPLFEALAKMHEQGRVIIDGDMVYLVQRNSDAQ